MPKRIAIVCLDAKGAVLRSWAILPAIFAKYPEAEVTWITNSGNKSLFAGNPFNVKVSTPEDKIEQNFDILYNLDTEKKATSLAFSINAEAKFGFYEENGYPMAYNIGAEYYLNTLFDDGLKKHNKKTYQQMIFDLAELPYNKEHCKIVLDENCKKYAADFVNKNSLSGKKIIGIHMGASSRWPSKVWSQNKVKEFIIKCSKLGYGVILFGGPNEVSDHNNLSQELQNEGISFSRNNPHNTDLEFTSLVNLCDYLVCSDSFSLHVGLALKRNTICLFFCTSPDEIEGYGFLTKIVSPMLDSFFPERMNEYNEELVNSITVDQVLNCLK